MLRNEQGQLSQIMALFVIIIIGLVVYSLWEARPQEKISINTSFDSIELGRGQAAKLTIEIQNLSDTYSATNVSVAITPFDPLVMLVSENQIVIVTLAPGEKRLPEFTITIASNAMKGTYTAIVSTSADSPFRGDSKKMTIEVK